MVMISNFLRLLMTIALIVLVYPVSGAVILVDDQFIDGGVTDGTDAKDAAWTFNNNGGTGSISIAAFDTSGNTTNSLRTAPGGSNFTWTRGTYTSQALNIGETLSLSLDFRITSARANSAAGLRFGFGSSADTFALTFGTGTTTGGAILRFGPNTLSGTSTNLSTSGTAFAVNDTLPHTFSLVIQRTGASSLSFTGAVDSNNFTGATTGTSNFTLDRIIFGQGGSAMGLNVDNVSASIVPEPSSMSLLIMSGMGLLLRARRRQQPAWN